MSDGVRANDVAVIGMCGRFPGAPDLDRFWRRLRAGDDLLTTFTDAELAAAGAPERVLRDPAYVKRAAHLPDAYDFDHEFFGYTRREAELLDPQQRLLLEVAQELLETVGYAGGAGDQAVGVFAGASMNTYLTNVVARACDPLGHAGTELMIANDKDYLTTRISYKLGLTGPSVNVQTACSTSLVAVHMAVQSLLAGECDVALAGGVSVIAAGYPGYFFSEGMILSPDGRCRPFDAEGAGTTFGDGVGVVALKRLAEAIEDGDRVLAVVKGSAINNDGSDKIGYTAPSISGQRAVITEAQAVAEVDSATVSYVEAHGTATTLGDPVEFAALTEAFTEGGARPGGCTLGSVKANVGHLAAAAGIAGFIKAVLALRHREIPGHPTFTRPNPRIDLAGSPFAINTLPMAWPAGETPRRAGVSSFGIGGTNAHVVLEEAPPRPAAPETGGPQLLAVSAKTEPALRELAARLARALEEPDAPALADAAYTLRRGRRGYAHRFAVVAEDHATAAESLRELAESRPVAAAADSLAFDGSRPAEAPAVAFRFGEISAEEFRMLVTQLPALADMAEPVPELALATLWTESGVHPVAVGGTGAGEVLAACFAGALAPAEAVALLDWRAGRRDRAPELHPAIPRLPVLSAVTGGELPPERLLDPRHWTQDVWTGDRHAFAGTTVLEIGAGESPLATAGRLWAAGVPVDWPAWSGEDHRRVPLPAHPLHRTTHRLAPPPAADRPAAAGSLPPDHEENTVEPLLAEVRTLVGGYFDVPPADLDAGVPFTDLGADSMALLGMLRLIEDRYSCKVTLRQVFGDLQTPAELAEYLRTHAPAGKLPGAPAPTPAPAPVAAAPATGVSTAVQDLIKEQLLVMQRQLEVLAGSEPAAPAAPEPPAPATKSVVPLWPGSRRAADTVETAQRTRYLKVLAERLGARTKRSKDFAQRYRPMVADSRSTVGFRPATKELLYPIVAERGRGARLWDIDGNEYVDLTLGYGVHLLGHNPPVVTSAVRERMDVGFSLGPRTQLVEDVAAGLLELTGMERVAFLNSGTEAVMTAVRLARAATGRDKIAVFSTAYHGHFDGVLAVPSRENGVFGTKPLAPGISPGAVENVYVLEFGTEEALDFLTRHGPELAAVLTEPVTLRTPGVQKPEFLRRLRELTHASGTKLIFDEMVTGFRCHPAGVQGLYGIEADLATYGKIVGGGLPLGVIAGRGGVMDAIDGGVWNFGDDSGPTVESTFFGGTFNQHPLTMAAAKAVLDHLRAEGPGLQRDLDRKTEVFAEQLNADFRELDLPIEVRRFSSIFKFEHEQNMDPFYFNLLDRGVFVWELRNFFLSTAHEQADLDHIRAAVRDSAEELRANGLLGERRTSSRPAPLRSTLAQRQLRDLDEGGVPAFEMSLGFRLDGPLDHDVLRGAVRELADRHESLRTTFGADGETLVVHPTPQTVLTEHTCETEAGLRDFLRTWAEQPPETAFRAAVVRTEPQRHLLLLAVHHALVDGWSYSVLLDDLAALYNAGCRGTSPGLPPAVQFRDYLGWHERVAAGPAAAAHRDHWHALLKEAPTPELPSAGQPESFPYRAVRHSVRLDPGFGDRMREAARAEGVTVFAYLVAAWGALLHRLTGQDDLVVPVASARRPPELDQVVGYCSNLVPLRLRVPSDVLVADFVAEVLDQLVTGLESQDYPFAALLADLAPPGAGLRSELFTTSMSFYRQVTVPALDGLVVTEAEPLPIRHLGHPLALNVVDRADGFRCDFESAAEVVPADLAERIPQYYRNLLEAMVDGGDRPLAELDHE
ncbi:aminotransferase class III-fold pyridoxal phosphate-dependent enzyme [Amycolatopsis sp. NPDC051102]|uniref:aminotransferase class III-fold pyridoxal phosphate-dependent enzyme n=1 Tax=Amycolatopsis sp. NPDC051102 TaxID=3155163 RepID=UPI00342BEB7D